MTQHGHTTWAFAGGQIPPSSTGPEPEFTAREELQVLNTGKNDAHLRITVYHHDSDPVGPYELEVGARRVRQVRLNDLIDPQAIPLGVPYGLLVESDVPVIVQLTRIDTRRHSLSTAAVVGQAV